MSSSVQLLNIVYKTFQIKGTRKVYQYGKLFNQVLVF